MLPSSPAVALATVPVFLSYAAADTPLVAKLLRHLRPLAAHGVQVYPDDADRPGAASSRLQRLHGAALILLLASPDALADADYQGEWQLALQTAPGAPRCAAPALSAVPAAPAAVKDRRAGLSCCARASLSWHAP